MMTKANTHWSCNSKGNFSLTQLLRGHSTLSAFGKSIETISPDKRHIMHKKARGLHTLASTREKPKPELNIVTGKNKNPSIMLQVVSIQYFSFNILTIKSVTATCH